MADSDRSSPDLSSVNTDTPNKRRFGRKPESAKSLQLDEDDLQHLRKPFSFGWKRELVYRNSSADPNSKKSMCDIYYFPPSGKKLRSMVEISSYLDSHKSSPVNLTHFTFQRKPLFHPPNEIVRTAGKANKQLKKVSALHKTVHKQAPPKTKTSSTIGRTLEKSTEKSDLSDKSASATQPTSEPLASAQDQATDKTSDTNNETSPEIIRNPDIQSRLPSTLPRSRGRPKGSKNSQRTSLSTLQRPILPKPRRLSPEWTPESAGYSRVPLTQKRVEAMDVSSESCSDDDDDNNDDDDDEDDDNYNDLQAVLGTPSKLIASIIRPDPPKRVLDDRDEGITQASKKMRFLSDSAQSLSETSTSYLASALGNCSTTSRTTFVVANSQYVASNLSKLCSSACPGMGGIAPSLRCKQCGQLYHPGCLQPELGCTDKSLCRNCAQKQMGCQQLRPQKSIIKLVSTSIGAQGLGTHASPVVLSPCIVTVSSLSSVLSKPLMTPSSQFMPQVLAPIFFIPGQNAATIPPPPPLASCPRFDTPVTLLPVQLTTDVPPPPPPRLQLCTIPQTCQPPSLHAWSGLPSCSEASSLSIHQSDMLTCPPLLTSKPSTVQPAVTTSSHPKIVSRPDKSSTQVPAKYLYFSASSKLRQPDTLTASTLQKPYSLVKISSERDSTGTIVMGLSGGLIGASKEAPPDKPVNTVDKSTLKTVRIMLKKRMKDSSPLSGSDVDDYPPVSFGEVTTESLSHLQSQLENTELERQKSNCYQAWPDDQLYSRKPPRMIKDILNRTYESSSPWVSASLPSTLNDFSSASQFVSVHADLSGVHAGISPYSQLSTRPHSFIPRLDFIETASQGTNNTELVPPDTYSSSSTAHSLLNFNMFEPTNVSTMFSHSQVKSKLARKSCTSSFRILHTSFPIMMKVFRCLSIPDLLRASCVCKVWHQLGLQPELWRHVRLDGVRIRDWEKAAKFLRSVGVKSLNVSSSALEASGRTSSADVWKNMQRAVPTLTCLERLFFEHVPVSVLDFMTDKMPHLVSIGAGTIADSDSISAISMNPTAKTVENMSHAIEAVTSGKVSTSNAAKLFQVSEKDLIHFTQTSNKLTSEEETAVLLCCLRLSRMGFSVQKDTVVSKCQEMFARRYSTTVPFPISDSCCSDLYHRNVPLFTPDTEVKSSDTLRERFNVHYSALRRLYNNLWPRATLKASQVLVFDLKPFHLDKEPGFNSLRSVAVTVLSVSSACTRSLPVLIVWPKFVETTHPCLISVMSKRGLPTFLQVFHYFQKILGLVKERPLVILCNGNTSLLSEKLISACVSDSVYLYCVPPDIAEYVFPGFHGGLLNILRTQIPDHGLTCGEFSSRLLCLLKSLKKTISRSTKLAFTATGVFPLNSRAPTQYQAVDLNIVPRQQFSWRKSGNLTSAQSSHSSRENPEVIVPDKPQSLVCNEAVNNQEVASKSINEHNHTQPKDRAKKSKPGQKQSHVFEKTTRWVINGKVHNQVSYARLLVKKMLFQARSGQNNSRTSSVKWKKPPCSSSSGDNLSSKISVGHAAAQSPLRLQDSHTKNEPTSVGKVSKLINHETEMDVQQIDITANGRSTHTECPQNNVKCHDSSCVTAELVMSTNSEGQKQTSADSYETNQKPYKKTSGGKVRAGVTLPISPVTHTKALSADEEMQVEDSVDKAEDMSDACLSDRNGKENKDSKKMSGKDISTGKKNKMSVHQNGGSLTINQATEREPKRKNQSKDKSQTTSATTAELTPSKDLINGSVSEANCCGQNKVDTDQDSRLKLLRQISLIDHDYILKFEESQTVSTNVSHNPDIDQEPASVTPYPHEITVGLEQVVTDAAVAVPVGNASSVESEDMIHVVTQDVTETVVDDQQCVSTSKSGCDSSISSCETSISSCSSKSDKAESDKAEETSPTKSQCRKTTRRRKIITKEDSSSNYTDSSSDEENDGSSESDSDDNKQASDVDEEDEDDDSKCQMCMRSTPPHFKDEIIDWVDCDQNCGRWFHVICVVRSQSKADTKHFVCPSCRCKR